MQMSDMLSEVELVSAFVVTPLRVDAV